MSFFVGLIISLAISIAVALLAPKPKVPKQSPQKFGGPTASAGRPIPVIWGEVTIKSPNCIGAGTPSHETFKVDA